MTTSLYRLHQELLELVSQSNGRWRKKQITSFSAMRGAKDSGDLMIVGRAVNGWTSEFNAEDLDKMRLQEILAETFAPSKGYDNQPMLWVSDCWEARKNYNTKKSAFWRVIRSTVEELGVADVQLETWPSFITWSNLYKISPAAGGNPSTALAGVQGGKCAEILGEEISVWKPRRILFLTGLGWAKPFLDKLDFRPEVISSESFIEAQGSIFSGARIVVGPHPQGKPEQSLVSSISEAFQSPPR
jgi:hypothetical protein